MLAVASVVGIGGAVAWVVGVLPTAVSCGNAVGVLASGVPVIRGVAVSATIGVGVNVNVGVKVAEGANVNVGVKVAVSVGVGVGSMVSVAVGVKVLVGVGGNEKASSSRGALDAERS